MRIRKRGVIINGVKMNLKDREDRSIVGVCPMCMGSDIEDLYNPSQYIKEGEKCYRLEFGYGTRCAKGEHIIFEVLTESCFLESLEIDYENEDNSPDYSDYYATMYLHVKCFKNITWTTKKSKEPIYCGCCGEILVGMQNVVVADSPELIARITEGLEDAGEFIETLQPDLTPDYYMCASCIGQHFMCHSTIMDALESVSQIYKQESDSHPLDEIIDDD